VVTRENLPKEVEKYKGVLLACCWKNFTPSRTESPEDVAQAIWLRVARRMKSGPLHNFKAYLRIVAVKVKKEKGGNREKEWQAAVHLMDGGLFERESQADCLDGLIVEEMVSRIYEELATDEQRAILDLCREGLSFKEAARKLGKRPEAVQQALQRLRKKVKATWPGEGHAEGGGR
jgi:RNA polymerase sigma factor (sigma-70 family)